MTIKVEAIKQIMSNALPSEVVSVGATVLAARDALAAELAADGFNPEDGYFTLIQSPGGGYVDLKWQRPS